MTQQLRRVSSSLLMSLWAGVLSPWCMSGWVVPVMQGAMPAAMERALMRLLYAACLQGQWRSIEDFWRDCGCPGDPNDTGSCTAAENPPAIEPVVLLPPEQTAACTAGPDDGALPSADNGPAGRLRGAHGPDSLLWHPGLLPPE